MATYSRPSDSEGVHMKDKCGICLGHFKNPKVLPCCHTFCEKCLKGILRANSNPDLRPQRGGHSGWGRRGKSRRKGLSESDAKSVAEKTSMIDSSSKLSCPQCRKEHEIPKNGIDGFLTDFTVLKAQPSVEECGQCGSAKLNDTISYCSDCAAYLCEFCTQAHKKMKLCRNHRLQLVKGTEPHQLEDSTQVIVSPQPLFCKKHLDEVLIVYCKECQCLVCCQCITDTHFGHKFNPINKITRKEVEMKLESLLDNSSKKLTQFRFYLDYVKAVESRKVSVPDKVKKEINGVCKNLITAIEKRRDELLLQVDTCSQDLKKLWSQKEQLETTIVALQSSLAFAKRSLNCKSDAEMLILSQQAMSRLSELNLSKWDSMDTERIDATETIFQQNGATYISPDSISQFGAISTSNSGPIPKLALKIYSKGASQWLEKVKLGENVRLVLTFQVRPSFIDQVVTVNIRNGGQQNVLNQNSNFTPLCVNDIENLQHQVELTFRPVVSGQHTISISIAGNTGQVNMNVSGAPQIGDHVTRGPNWQSPPAPTYDPYGYQYGRNYGHLNYAYNNGIVTDVKANQIYVCWDGQVTTQHNWNEYDCYFEIKLV